MALLHDDVHVPVGDVHRREIEGAIVGANIEMAERDLGRARQLLGRQEGDAALNDIVLEPADQRL
jgi:hypothetical protein